MKRTAAAALLSFSLLSSCSIHNSKPAAQPATPTNDSVSSAPAGHDASADASPQNSASTNTEVKDELHTPAKGTAEREAIMDLLRAEVQKESGVEVVFVVNYLKVHNGWAWVDVTPNRKDGTNLYEGKEALLHQENGLWKDMPLPPQDEDDERMFGDLSRRYISKLQKQYPSVPLDIFPKPSDD